ncbi:MAG TPA: Uma2 family endonuclease [Candidatus Limnocylindrales bacterium]
MTVMEIRIPPDLTVDDLDELHLDGRYELHEGNLVIMSPALPWHYDFGWRLVNYFRRRGRHANGEVGLKLGESELRVPDVAVFHGPFDRRRTNFKPSDIAIAIEVVSPSSEIQDSITKPWQYAHAGIPEYWRVESTEDTDDATIHQFVLGQDADGEPAYRKSGETRLSELEKGAG